MCDISTAVNTVGKELIEGYRERRKMEIFETKFLRMTLEVSVINRNMPRKMREGCGGWSMTDRVDRSIGLDAQKGWTKKDTPKE